MENSERDGLPENLTCLLRNLYGDQEATIRIGHGTTDWFQLGLWNEVRDIVQEAVIKTILKKKKCKKAKWLSEDACK